MKVLNLSSGSEGNSTYIQAENTRILLDAGLSASSILKRLALISVTPNMLDGIIISHEHSDHCKGVDVLSHRYNIPVYAHRTVWEGLERRITRVPENNRKMFDGDEFFIKDLKVCPFLVPHDVPNFGFSFEENDKKVSILTDLGHTNDRILECIQHSQIVYLESNYDKTMLSRNTRYPLTLKRRIAGPYGHLSNEDAAELLVKLAMTGTKQIVLSHLSKDNNSPNLAYTTAVRTLLTYGLVEGVHVRVDVASTKPGVMFKIS